MAPFLYIISQYSEEEKNAPPKQERRWEPARKPRHLQWSAIDRFVCGQCKATFTTRFAQSRHLQRTNHAVKRENKRDREKTSMATSTVKRMQRNHIRRKHLRDLMGLADWKPKGRPRHSQHACGCCGRELASASKKRDHQRRCKK